MAYLVKLFFGLLVIWLVENWLTRTMASGPAMALMVHSSVTVLAQYPWSVSIRGSVC